MSGHHIGNGLFSASHDGLSALTMTIPADTMPDSVWAEPESIVWRIRQLPASLFAVSSLSASSDRNALRYGPDPILRMAISD
ncbi:MAG: hypothetical protein LZF60_80179 [Nitrospira sp.]|nr:MAG: hypothetical protein LZF60_80179 [Nitrospira sp.]